MMRTMDQESQWSPTGSCSKRFALEDAHAARRIIQKHTAGARLLSVVAQHYAESQAAPDFLDLIKNPTQ